MIVYSVHRILVILALGRLLGNQASPQHETFSQEHSDQFGVLAGTVRDSVTSQPLSGAIIQLKSGWQGCASDLQGRFEVLRIPPGRHTFIFSCVGFDSVIMNDLEITSGKVTNVIVSLPWWSPPDFADQARRELSKGIVHLWRAGLFVGYAPDSSFTAKYGFLYVDHGCDPSGVHEHNKPVEEFLEKRNGKGWKELFEKEWKEYLRRNKLKNQSE